MNTAAREGLNLEDHLGQPGPKWLKDIYPREVFQTLLKSIQESLNQGKVWRGEAQLNGANGGPIPVSQQVHLHVDLQGHRGSFCGQGGWTFRYCGFAASPVSVGRGGVQMGAAGHPSACRISRSRSL